jgi:hypothetical protein
LLLLLALHHEELMDFSESSSETNKLGIDLCVLLSTLVAESSSRWLQICFANSIAFFVCL